MIFLRDKIASGDTNPDLIKAWFMFPEVKQNWMGLARLTCRACPRSPEKLSPSQSLDRDGERVITKVVVGRRNHSLIVPFEMYTPIHR